VQQLKKESKTAKYQTQHIMISAELKHNSRKQSSFMPYMWFHVTSSAIKTQEKNKDSTPA